MPAPGAAPKAAPGIAIVGGGFAGAAVAFHLARRGIGATVFEPRPALGAGVAYSSRDPAHRINVPADRMSLLPDRPDDFDAWLSAGPDRLDPEATTPDGRRFPRRASFGAYMADRLAPWLAAGAIRHDRRAVAAIALDPDGFGLATADGATHAAAAVVLALSHPPPAPPAPLAAIAGHPSVVADPWREGALAGIGARDRVLILGTGLSMADVVASLEKRGHRGPMLALSRRGQLSRGHAAVDAPIGDFGTAPARSARALVARVRGEVAAAGARGLPWQAVLDAVRRQAPAIWAALPEDERRRLIRHARPFWDTHRFRVAPQVEAAVARARAEGRLEIRAGGLVSARESDGAVEIASRGRGGIRTGRFDRVVVTTGPGHAGVLRAIPCLAGLARAGLIEPDPAGLGLRTDRCDRAVGRGGEVRALFVAGPLARGRVGELMGLPEVAAQARDVAGAVAVAV